jgi:predicted HAD superfamily Cof-like phosphohydrolase
VRILITGSSGRIGAAIELGVDLGPVFGEVHRSNMSKDGGTDAGGKILKGPGFTPPDVLGVLA